MTAFKAGDAVRDIPTGTMTTVVEVLHEEVDGEPNIAYRVNDNVPLDPCYPNHWRNDFELELCHADR
jgi:hypothetical protein